MRKGAATVPWTTSEERYLLEHAGIDPIRSICRALKRSRRSVECKASRLHVSLRVYESLTVICPKCGEARSKRGRWTSRTGICEVCRMRDSYREAKWAQAEAYAALPPADRATYDRTEAATGRSGLPPRPREPSTYGMAPARARRARELHALDVERWEKACLKKLTDAAKTRTKRMREKTGTNPRKGAGNPRETNEKFEGLRGQEG